jgi:hypothetical protein
VYIDGRLFHRATGLQRKPGSALQYFEFGANMKSAVDEL